MAFSENEILQELEKHVCVETQGEIKHREYPWLEKTWKFNAWDFINQNSSLVEWLALQLDISDNIKSGWTKFAEELGLNDEEIKWCLMYHKKGPTKEVLHKLKKKFPDLELGRVLQVLVDLQRHDLLRHLPWEKGLEKIQPTNSEDKINCTKSKLDGGKILLNNFHVNQNNAVPTCQELMVKTLKDNFPKKKIAKFGCKILLVYAQDVKECALQVVSQLRNPNGVRESIGVLLLRENSVVYNQLLEDPFNSLHKWFKQVDFIVPLLSPYYLHQIQSITKENNQELDNEDLAYHRFLYQLTLNEYVANGCRNLRCRALCPSNLRSQIMRNPLVVGNPLFQIIWSGSMEIMEEFSSILIEAKKCKKKKNNFS